MLAFKDLKMEWVGLEMRRKCHGFSFEPGRDPRQTATPRRAFRYLHPNPGVLRHPFRHQTASVAPPPMAIPSARITPPRFHPVPGVGKHASFPTLPVQ